jgi:hypothetical protein
MPGFNERDWQTGREFSEGFALPAKGGVLRFQNINIAFFSLTTGAIGSGRPPIPSELLHPKVFHYGANLQSHNFANSQHIKSSISHFQ